ncbi:hypothetical protein, partial [Pedobacter sp. UBA4863]
EELDMEQAKKKSTFWSDFFNTSSSGIIRDSVLSVENNILGNLVLMTGYIGWRSMELQTPTGKKHITDQGFIYREKVKIKDDASGRRLTMVGFQTDAPSEFFSTGRTMSNWDMSNSKTYGNGQKRVSSSSGDVMVVSCVNTLGMKDPATGEKIFGTNIRYVAQRYSAKNLQKIAETPFDFKYSYKKLYDQPATDGSNDMLMLFAPTHGGVKPYFAPNKSEYEYLRIGVDTKTKERTKFISPYGRLNNVYIYNLNDETIILGTSKAGNEDKYADFTSFKGNDDQLIVIRIKNGQKAVVKATAMKSIGVELSRFSANGAIKTAENQVWIAGQAFEKKENDPEKWGNIYAFNISTDGSLVKNLTLPQVEKASEKMASPVYLLKLNDGDLLWAAYEITKKGNMYPKYAKISNGNLGTVIFPGDKKYVVSDRYPMYISPDNKELIYFGNTEDNKQLWLHKQTL